MRHKLPYSGLGVLLGLLAKSAGAAESIEFVTEHLPEIAMDNRYASLPLWNRCGTDVERSGDTCFGLSAAYQRTHSGTFAIDGPLLALSASRTLGANYRATAFLFFDDFALTGGSESRPLDVTFTRPPLALPASAQYSGLDGNARDLGAGISLSGDARWRWLPAFEWTAGLVWQRLKSSHYEFDYQITDGPDSGTTGTLDYSATYSHFSPFVGASWPRWQGDWGYAPHVLVAMPLPRRGVQGRITGPGFDLEGDAASNGAGKHFGDPSVSIGLNISYVPWNLTVDLGSALTQALVEPRIHEGVKKNWLLSAEWTF